MKKIAIIGFGVVGSGVYEIIRKNKDLLTKKAGEEIDVKRILDIRDFDSHEEAHLFTKDFNDLVNDDEISLRRLSAVLNERLAGLTIEEINLNIINDP